MAGRVHIIGAGLAGLSAAVRLSQAGARVSIHETTQYAGGRCRSFHDDQVDAVIDNGTHLILSGNTEVLAYLERVGARDNLVEGARAAFDFLDVQNDRRWSVDLGFGVGALSLIKWLADKHRQPPGLKPFAFLRDIRTLKRGRDKTVAQCLDTKSELYRTFWHPLCLAVLNAEPQEAAAVLIWAVLKATVFKGGAYARPLFAPNGLGPALVDPAMAYLRSQDVSMYFQRRISSLVVADGLCTSIRFHNAAEVLGDSDAVIMAVPHHAVAELVDGVDAPDASRAILNVHYRLSGNVDMPAIVGLVGGECQWLFRRGPIVSVTVSGANAWMDKDTDAIAHALWPEVARALRLDGDIPAYRVIKERRATFAATPEALAHRPGTRTAAANLYLAGDWTDTGLPATIEGAVKSGRMAAEAVLASASL